MKTRIIFFFLIIVASCIQAQVRMVAGQSVLFEKQDVIDLATYNWPRTLISYVVVFDGGVKEEMLSLTDKSQGVPVKKRIPATRQSQFLCRIATGGEICV